MSTFKITPPEGILKDHLSGRKPKDRNFELLRLATSGLLLEKGRLSASVFSMQDKNVTRSVVEPEPNDIRVDVTAKEEAPEVLTPVDFGDDLIKMS